MPLKIMPKEDFPRNWHQPFQDKDWNNLETAKTVTHEKTQKEKDQEKIKHNIISVSGLFLEEPMVNILHTLNLTYLHAF